MSKSSSLRRIQADIRELAKQPSDRYHAAPLEDDMFEWHFTIRGADETEFEGGVYHGRILLPPEYPFKPPHIVFLTPSGRFEVNTKVCLSFSAYHPELWQPAWGIRLILEALISFLPAPADGAIGALDWSKEERKKLAKKSVEFECRQCGNCANLLPKLGSLGKKKHKNTKFSKDVQKLRELQSATEGAKKKKSDSECVPCKTKEVKNIDGESNNNESTAQDVSTHINTVDTSTSNITDLETPNSPTTTNEKTTEPENVDQTESNVQEETTAVPEPAPVVAPAPEPMANPDSPVSWLSDPLLHGSIVTFAAIVFLLFRKVDSLFEELRMLNENEYN